jgi:hypothetical protein
MRIILGMGTMVAASMVIAAPAGARDMVATAHNVPVGGASSSSQVTWTASSALAAEEQRALAIRDSSLRITNERRALERQAHRWEMLYLAASAADLAVTINCLEAGKCVEQNPLFGKRPKSSTLLLGKVIGGAVHYGVFRYTLARSPRTALRFAQISAGVQGGVVMLNMRVAF